MRIKFPNFYAKLLFAIIFCFIIPLSCLFIYAYSRLDAVITQKMSQIAQQEMEKTHAAVEGLFSRIDRTVEHISVDNRLNKLMHNYDAAIPRKQEPSVCDQQSGVLTDYEYLQWALEIQKILGNYSTNWLDTSSKIALIFDDGHILTTWPAYNTDTQILWSTLHLDSEIDSENYFVGPHSTFVYYTGEDTYFTRIKELYNLESPKDHIGTLVVTTPISALREVIHANQSDNRYTFYLLDRDRNSILDENTDYISKKDVLALYDSRNSRTTDNYDIGNAIFWDALPIVETGWLLCHAIPEKLVFPEILQLRDIVIWSFFGLLVFISIITFIIIYRLLKPIRQLTDGMHQVEKGNINLPPLKVSSYDEVGMITVGFNNLMEQQRQLIHQIQETEKQKGELRFEMLLAQINPHFLFNTLNSIKWMAALIHADKIADTIRDLARLLEISMNKQADFISIQSELLNLKSYIAIQRVRYGDTFDVRFHIDPVLNEYETIKLLFQPVVENAIIHNMQDVPELCIDVEGQLLEDQTILFTITDNGKGMDEMQLKQLFSLDRNGENRVFRGIGIANVLQRIQLRYGSQYGISIQSSLGCGTCVKITLPAIPIKAPQ